jgi:hypothetical protein
MPMEPAKASDHPEALNEHERLIWVLRQPWASSIEIHIVLECVRLLLLGGPQSHALSQAEATHCVQMGLLEALVEFAGELTCGTSRIVPYLCPPGPFRHLVMNTRPWPMSTRNPGLHHVTLQHNAFAADTCLNLTSDVACCTHKAASRLARALSLSRSLQPSLAEGTEARWCVSTPELWGEQAIPEPLRLQPEKLQPVTPPACPHLPCRASSEAYQQGGHTASAGAAGATGSTDRQ